MKKRTKLWPALILVLLCLSISLCGGATNTSVPTATETPKNNPKDTPVPTPTVANIGGPHHDEVSGGCL